MEKGLKLKVRKSGGLNPKSVEVTGDKRPFPCHPKKMNGVKNYALLDTGLEENGFL